MPELLGVTNPVPGYDGNHTNRNIPVQPGTGHLQNVPDPSRVTGADRRSEQQDAGTRSQNSIPRFDSNFQSFLQRLRDTPELSMVLSRLFAGKGTQVSSGIGEGSAEEISRFLKMLQMDEGEFLRFLTRQLGGDSRFSGPLFAMLRDAYQNAESQGMRGDILLFLKRYGDHSSTRHIEGNILRNLNRMARAIPASYGSQLVELIAKLENGVAAGDRAGNLKLLMGRILPFMSDYVGRTHDLGYARSLLTLLALDIARYENGSQENLLQAFHQLKNYVTLRDRLGALDEGGLMRLLQSSLFAKAPTENVFANQLATAAAQALQGGSGTEAQAAFRELVSAFLVNESVYMPINHLMIPLNWSGKMMFSELWVDPDAQGEGQGEGKTERTLRILFKLDIESLGFFDMVLVCQGEKVDLQIHCPERVAPFAPVVERSVGEILSRNGFQSQVRVRKMERPLTISEVFPKVFAGKDSINVKV